MASKMLAPPKPSPTHRPDVGLLTIVYTPQTSTEAQASSGWQVKSWPQTSHVDCAFRWETIGLWSLWGRFWSRGHCIAFSIMEWVMEKAMADGESYLAPARKCWKEAGRHLHTWTLIQCSKNISFKVAHIIGILYTPLGSMKRYALVFSDGSRYHPATQPVPAGIATWPYPSFMKVGTLNF